jgi:hypothetical protein
MVGVAETVMSKSLGNDRHLIVHSQWEGDEGLLAPNAPTDGTLPGGGVISYMIAIRQGNSLDFETLQELIFRGGGEVNFKDIPAKVQEAFEKWFEKLDQE